MNPIALLGPAVLLTAAAVTAAHAGDACEGRYSDRFPPANYLDASPIQRIYRMDTDGDGPLPERTIFVGGDTNGGGIYGSLWGTPGSSPFNRSAGFQVREGGLILPMPATNSVGGRPLSAAAAFDPDAGGPATTMVYVGGANIGTDVGVPFNRTIARYDGASWAGLPDVSGVADDMVLFDEDGAGPMPARLFASGTVARTGEPASFLLRFDGTTWTDVGAGLDGRARVLLVADPDGDGPIGESLIVGGDFSMAGANPASRIAAWDGTNWHSLGQGVDATVRALVMHDDDNDESPSLFIGGDFANADGAPATRVAKFDGAGWVSTGALFSGQVKAMASFDDDDDGATTLFVGGKALLFPGETGGHALQRLDNGEWTPIDTRSGSSSREVYSLAMIDPDSEGPRPTSLVVVCNFGTNSIVANPPFAAWLFTWDGTEWGVFDDAGYAIRVNSVATYDADGDGPAAPLLIVGGSIGVIGGVSVSNVAAFDGQNWHPLGDGLVGEVFALTEYDADGPGGAPPLLIAGNAAQIGGVKPIGEGVAAWNGSSWQPTGDQMFQFSVLAVVDHDDDGPKAPVLYGGGSTLNEELEDVYAVARWTGSNWESVATSETTEFALSQPLAMTGFDPDGPGPSPRLLMVADRNGGSARSLFSFDGASFAPFVTTLQIGINEYTSSMVEFVESDAPDGPPSLIVRRGFLQPELSQTPTELRIGRWRDGVTSLMPRIDYPPFQPEPGMLFVPGETLAALTVADPDGPGPMRPDLFALVGDLRFVGLPPLWKWNGADWQPLDGVLRLPQPCAVTPWDPDGEGPAPTSVVYPMGGPLTFGFSNEVRVSARGLYEWIPAVPAALIESPQSLIVRPGDSASFKVLAVGTDASIAWRKDSAPLPDGAFSTERSWIIAIDSATTDDRGLYTAVISNLCAEVTSAPAELRVRVLEGDSNADTVVDFDDIVNTLAHWGADYGGATGPGDADSNAAVDMDDLVATLKNWLAQED